MPFTRKKIFAGLLVFAVVYLIVHYLIFDRGFRFTTVSAFISEGKDHFWHILPLVLIFLAFFAKEAYDRIKRRGSYASHSTHPQ